MCNDNNHESLGITDQTIQDALIGILTGEWETDDTALDELTEVKTFENAGLLTYDKGLVLRLSDGSEFQLTIIQRS